MVIEYVDRWMEELDILLIANHCRSKLLYNTKYTYPNMLSGESRKWTFNMLLINVLIGKLSLLVGLYFSCRLIVEWNINVCNKSALCPVTADLVLTPTNLQWRFVSERGKHENKNLHKKRKKSKWERRDEEARSCHSIGEAELIYTIKETKGIQLNVL